MRAPRGIFDPRGGPESAIRSLFLQIRGYFLRAKKIRFASQRATRGAGLRLRSSEVQNFELRGPFQRQVDPLKQRLGA